MSSVIRRVAQQILEESKGDDYMPKESWWWSGEVQKAIKEKRTYLKPWKEVERKKNFQNII